MLGGRDLEALHPLRQGGLVAGLHQQVHVRALHAELDDAEVIAPGGGQCRLADRLVHASAAQVADCADNPQRDVDGVPRLEIRPLLVRRSGSRALRGSTRAAPLAAALLPQRQLLRLAVLPPLQRAFLDGHASLIIPDCESGNRFRRYILEQLSAICEWPGL
jgi:hypothetical protein